MRGVALSEDGMEQAGMGVGVGDYDLDGHLDLFKTHFADDANVLYRNDGKGNFDDVTAHASWRGDAVRRLGSGNRRPGQRRPSRSVYGDGQRLSRKSRRKLPQYPKDAASDLSQSGQWHVRGVDASGRPRSGEPHCSRGCAFGDFDNDGDIDVLIVNLNEPPSLLRNDLSGSSQLDEIETRGRKVESQRDRSPSDCPLWRKAQAQAVLSQSSFYSCNDPRLHFGLGASSSADLEICWPNGLHEQLKNVPANQLSTLREGTGI